MLSGFLLCIVAASETSISVSSQTHRAWRDHDHEILTAHVGTIEICLDLSVVLSTNDGGNGVVHTRK
jgi:hypothetical protein